MTRNEFEKGARRAYLINEIKNMTEGDAIMTPEEYIIEVGKMFDNLFRFKPESVLYLNGKRIDCDDYYDDEEYYILQYIQRKIEVSIRVNLMDLEYFEELSKK